jgi:hypothetical protein
MVAGLEKEEDKGWLIAQHHDNLLMGHPGLNRMIEKIRRTRLDCKGLAGDVASYMQGCLKCQKVKPWEGPTPGEMSPLSIPNMPWKEMAWDLVRPLKESNGYNVIAKCMDINRKEVKFQATTMEVAGLGITRILWDRVVKDRRLPKKIYSDHGPQFMLMLMKELYRMLRVEGNPSSAY